MRLGDLIKSIDENYITIEYRTYTPGGEDILAGYCRWNGMQLISMDGDSYSLDDEITKYEINVNTHDKILLTVWYESSWVTEVSKDEKV